VTRLVRVHLGTAPGQYKLAFDQTAAFKRQLRAVLPTPDGASLITVTDHGTMWVEAVCDGDRDGSREWASRAAELAPEVWASLAVRRKERVRG
jgi:uncharacterized membrane-anchored protein